MNFFGLIFQAAESAGIGSISGYGIFLAAAFGFIVLASAFFAFVVLRKTLKMAMRLVIVSVLALIALVGTGAFLWIYSSSGDTAKPRPANSRSR